MSWADPGFFQKEGGGVYLRSTSKKGGPGGGPILGPMLKSLRSRPKGSRPLDPLDPPMHVFIILHFVDNLCNCLFSISLFPPICFILVTPVNFDVPKNEYTPF